MENSRTLSLIVTMAVTFTLSLAFIWRQERAPAPPGPAPNPVQVAAAPVEGRPTPMPRAPAEYASAADFQAGKAPARAPAAATASNNLEAPPLPVMFILSKGPAYVFDENRGGVRALRDVNEGIVTNESEESLEITVTELNLPTMESSQIQFSLWKGSQRHFGVGDGLKMLSGDQLTLSSPAHRDSTKIIP